MSLEVVLRPLASAEWEEAADRYEKQRAGLGAEFSAEVLRVLEVFAENPERYPVVRLDVREGLTSTFPYAIYYRVRTNRIVVIAVFHGSRNPEEWQRRR
jgi:plasmid stabilization system protein ParE